MVPGLDLCLLAWFGWYRLCSQYFPYTAADRSPPPKKPPRYIHVFKPNDADWGGFNQGVALLNAIRRCSCCLSPSLFHRGSHPCMNTPASVCACVRVYACEFMCVCVCICGCEQIVFTKRTFTTLLKHLAIKETPTGAQCWFALGLCKRILFKYRL